MERSELIERLVPLIPPPRAHQVRYHGILAPCASWRDWIVPGPTTAFGVPPCDPPNSNSIESFPAGGEARERGGEGERERNAELRGEANEGAGCDQQPESAAESASQAPASTGTSTTHPRRLRWAALLQRVFEVDALRCPGCGARMRLLAAIEDPEVARKILECLDLPRACAPSPTRAKQCRARAGDRLRSPGTTKLGVRSDTTRHRRH
jgi:hypothetical protein